MQQLKTKLADFSAAHRVVKGYHGKCKNLHGHNYMVYVTLTADKLDQYDFLVDFGDIKEHCNNWLFENWDHTVIVSSVDHELLEYVKKDKQRHYIIPEGKNTTVEVLSEYLFHQFTELLSQKVTTNDSAKLLEVEVWETTTSCAKYSA